MIGKLSGRIDYRGTDHVLIDVRGVGYMVYCSERTMAALPGSGEVVALYTDLLVREDLLQLFGFTTPITLRGPRGTSTKAPRQHPPSGAL